MNIRQSFRGLDLHLRYLLLLLLLLLLITQILLTAYYIHHEHCKPNRELGKEKCPCSDAGNLIPQINQSRLAIAAEEKPNMKRIVFWTTIYEKNYNVLFPKGQDILVQQCKRPCELSRVRSTSEIYDALIFHTRDKHYPPTYRSPNQVYIAYTDEPPYYQYRDNKSQKVWYYEKGSFYNWTVSPLRSSTFQIAYYRTIHQHPTRGAHVYGKYLQKYQSLKKKRNKATPAVLWIVSNCSPWSERQLYVYKLRKYIPVDIYGKCVKKRCNDAWYSDDCIEKLYNTGNYKFYLALENCLCRDYISEKAFRPLKYGLVPIVLGGLTGDEYSQPGVLPPNSYIDVRNFTSPEALADYLKLLDNNEEMYLSYHKWRVDYQIVLDHDKNYFSWMCDVCDALYDENYMKPHKSVDFTEFYSIDKHCNNSFVRNILSKSSDTQQ